MGYLFLLLVTLFRCTVRNRHVVLLHRQRLLSCYLICSMTAGPPAAGFTFVRDSVPLHPQLSNTFPFLQERPGCLRMLRPRRLLSSAPGTPSSPITPSFAALLRSRSLLCPYRAFRRPHGFHSSSIPIAPPVRRPEHTSFPRRVGHPGHSIRLPHGTGPYAPISPPSTSSHPTPVTVPPITSAPSS